MIHSTSWHCGDGSLSPSRALSSTEYLFQSPFTILFGGTLKQLEEQTHKTNQQIKQKNEPAKQIENRIVRACEATGRRRTAKTQRVQQYPSVVHYLCVSDYPTLYLTQSKQRMRQPMDTYTTAFFLKTQTKTRWF